MNPKRTHGTQTYLTLQWFAPVSLGQGRCLLSSTPNHGSWRRCLVPVVCGFDPRPRSVWFGSVDAFDGAAVRPERWWEKCSGLRERKRWHARRSVRTSQGFASLPFRMLLLVTSAAPAGQDGTSYAWVVGHCVDGLYGGTGRKLLTLQDARTSGTVPGRV